jgi:hypothetical protein
LLSTYFAIAQKLKRSVLQERKARMNHHDMPETYHPSSLKSLADISYLLSGDACFAALKQAIDEVCRTASKGDDVLISAFNLSVREVRYIEPHTFLFSGFTNEGKDSVVVAHYSQVIAHVISSPKQDSERFITGFSSIPIEQDTE